MECLPLASSSHGVVAWSSIGNGRYRRLRSKSWQDAARGTSPTCCSRCCFFQPVAGNMFWGSLVDLSERTQEDATCSRDLWDFTQFSSPFGENKVSSFRLGFSQEAGFQGTPHRAPQGAVEARCMSFKTIESGSLYRCVWI